MKLSAQKQIDGADLAQMTDLNALRQLVIAQRDQLAKRDKVLAQRDQLIDILTEQLKRLRPISKETLDFINRARGRPLSENRKQAVSLRLDHEVVEHFKKSGPGWQSRMNDALRKQAKLKG